MEFAWWPHTTNRAVASYRLRCYQVIQQLRYQGVDAGIFRPGEPPNVLVLSKRYDEKSRKYAEKLREKYHTRLILDLCDNHFYADSPSAAWLQRAACLRSTVLSVDQVVASSTALAAIIQAEVGDNINVHVIEDAVEQPFTPGFLSQVRHPLAAFQVGRAGQLAKWLKKEAGNPGRRLVWFGNHGSSNASGGMTDLNHIREALEAANQVSRTSLTVISNNKKKFETMSRTWALPVHYLEWHPNTFSAALSQHDIAVIPIIVNPFTLCKTNNRVATALLHGLGVVADAIPSYHSLRDCVVLDDWDQGFQRMLNDTSYRRASVEAGAAKIRNEWTLERVASRWLEILKT